MTNSNSSATLLKTLDSLTFDLDFIGYCKQDVLSTVKALNLEQTYTMELGVNPEQEFCYWAMPLGYSRFEYAEMDQWITETLGIGGWWDPSSNWVGSSQRYWFKKESHRTLFVLKWAR